MTSGWQWIWRILKYPLRWKCWDFHRQEWSFILESFVEFTKDTGKMLMHFLTKNNIFLTTAQFVFLSFSVFCKSSSFVKLKKSKHSFKVRMRSYTLISLTCSSLLYAPTRIPISPKEVLFFQAVDQLKEARRSSSAALCPSADLCFKVWL